MKTAAVLAPGRILLAATLQVMAAAACHDLPGDGEVETEFFIVHYRAAHPPTSEELAALDLHFRIIGLEAMSVPSSAAPFHLYLYLDENDVRENAPCDGLPACVRGTRTHTSRTVHRHELVHTYLGGRCDHTIALLEEGLAEALSRTGPAPYPLNPEFVSVAEVARSDDFYGTYSDIFAHAYDVAGAFVSWLVSEYGLETVLDAACSLRYGAKTSHIERVFRTSFGAGITELEDRARASWPALPSAPCPWDSLRKRTLEIGATELIPAPPGRLLPEPVFLPSTARYARVRLDVESGTPSGSIRGGLYQCGDPRTGSASPVTGAIELWTPVDSAGRYLLDTPDVGEIGSGEIRVEVVDREPLRDWCDQDVPTPITFDGLFVRLLSIGVLPADHLVDYPTLDPTGLAVADSAGPFVLDQPTEIKTTTNEDRAVWVCPGGCGAIPPRGCRAVPELESVCLDPGVYMLVAVWYESSPPDYPYGDPRYFISGRRDLSLLVTFEPTGCGN